MKIFGATCATNGDQNDMTIEEIQKSTEYQVFDRKSARIDAKALAITIIAFANADGGRIAIGVEDDGTLTGAAVLLFGKNPQRFFQRAQVRLIRYDGTEAKVGTEMNVVKDEIFTGPILKLTNDVLAFVKTQIKEHTYLGQDGRFRTDPQYPEFCWTELCVNAICHRDYSILGTDIQVKLFDDHMTVESPGILPGLVRPNNIREMHFSRNPKIALYMRNHKLVKEFGEGVDRMFREMAEAGLPAPEYRQNEFMVYATIRQHGGKDYGKDYGKDSELDIGES